MAAKGLSMRDIRELFRLRFEAGLRQEQVALALGCGRSTVSDYERRAKEAGLCDWASIKSLNEEDLFLKLGLQGPLHFFKVGTPRKSEEQQPDWAFIRKELAKKHVTKMLVWEEYRAGTAEGYGYSQFCEQYRRWIKKGSLVMRQEHKAGEKAFIDYAGTTVPIVDSKTAEILFDASIFIGVMGASSYTFIEASRGQNGAEWIASHRRMLEFFGGVPEILVPDNLKSGITKADRYEALVNENYRAFCEHYKTCVIPARAQRPKDKAKVEVGVLVVSRYILAALRNQVFHSLAELNEAIRPILLRLNDKKMRQYGQSRRELFLEIDLPALGALPSAPFEFAEWARARVNIDYHIAYAGHFYSAPYELIGKEVEVRATVDMVEVLHRCERVASHQRSFIKGRYTTDEGHRPPAHAEHLKWTPERIKQWAEKTGGPDVCKFIDELMKQRQHPEQTFRSALGVLRLSGKYTPSRLGLACARALEIGSISYQSVKNILKNNMESMPLPGAVSPSPSQKEFNFLERNENVRGKKYYH